MDNPLSAGPHALIRDGAILVTKLDDILEGLHPLPDAANEPLLFDSKQDQAGTLMPKIAKPDNGTAPQFDIGLDGLSDIEHSILAEIGIDAAGVDLIIKRTALPAPVVLQALTFLTLKGKVKRIDGQTFARTR